VMACCNTLMNIEGELVGDPLEKAAFLASGWQLSASSAGAVVRGPLGGTQVSVRHLQTFHFSSELKRMASVVRVTTSRGAESDYVLAKGAPEALQRYFASVPEGYERAHKAQAARGSRVIALAAKQLHGKTVGELKALSRAEVRSHCIVREGGPRSHCSAPRVELQCAAPRCAHRKAPRALQCTSRRGARTAMRRAALQAGPHSG
jgi:magnesium-transporting ATPase (P-type)